jgi:hemerythrin-like domain-containing protein
MSQTIDNLMREHRVIEQVLGALETFVEMLPLNADVGREEVAKFAGFFQNFADKCHHGKEEDGLFVKMGQYGFPREYGPVGVMLAEHNEGRSNVRALAEIGGKSGPLSAQEIQQVTRHSLHFISLLRGHIQKEDNILYPMALQAIPASELARLDAACVEFEREVMGLGEIERLHDLAVDLADAYPPDAAKMEAASACVGCHGHAF